MPCLTLDVTHLFQKVILTGDLFSVGLNLDEHDTNKLAPYVVTYGQWHHLVVDETGKLLPAVPASQLPTYPLSLLSQDKLALPLHQDFLAAVGMNNQMIATLPPLTRQRLPLDIRRDQMHLVSILLSAHVPMLNMDLKSVAPHRIKPQIIDEFVSQLRDSAGNENSTVEELLFLAHQIVVLSVDENFKVSTVVEPPVQELANLRFAVIMNYKDGIESILDAQQPIRITTHGSFVQARRFVVEHYYLMRSSRRC